MEPEASEAPVVIYRKLPPSEGGGGYLVTGFVDRDVYRAYEHAAPHTFWQTPVGKTAVGVGGLAALWALVRAAARTGGSALH
jgi:hypothetical protein